MIMSRSLIFLGITALAGLALPAGAQSGIAEELDGVFSRIPAQAPGCTVGLVSNGRWLIKTGYGLANLELDVPLDGIQVHRMGSVSKQFTAMAVLLLAEEGKIELDADVHRYLPELPDYGATVTVNAMLGHVAGMGDYDLIAGSYEGPKAANGIELKSAAGGEFRLGNEDYLTIQEFYEVVKQAPLAQQPDERFLYSNLAYFLLSMLVEEVSGESLRTYAERRIFKPLGMDSTFFSDLPVEIVRKRAYGYKQNEDGDYVNDMTNLFWVGDGGLHTNLDDLLKWDQNFYEPRVGKDPMALIETMNRPNSEHKDRGRLYANGQFLATTAGEQSFEHSGGWLGTTTFYARFPQQRRSLMMMCNDASLDIDPLVEQTLQLLLEADAAAK
jgi:CubicO group peptidase (beta-lactamase class C family)